MTKTALAVVTVVGLGLGPLGAPVGAQETGPETEEAAGLEARVAALETAVAEGETEEGEGDGWDVQWKDTFRVKSPDGSISLKFGGRIQNDWAFYSADGGLEAAVGAFEEGTEFRRARLYFEGELYERVELKAQYDFAGGDPELKDVYLGLVNLPGVGGARVGHYKEPYSLDEQTSSKYLTFMERPLIVEAFSPSRNTGFMLHRSEERYTWAVGLFRDADDFGDAVESDELNATARVTGLPWYADGGRRLVHLGAAVSEREPTGDRLRFRSRPESHLAPRIVDTGTFGADGLTLVSLEGAVVNGPFHAQGEYAQAAVSGTGADDADFDGFYVQGGWFLTGEHRPYGGGSFGRVKPGRPLGTGPGAWEVAVRYSTLDLTDGPVAGGEVDDVALALNWYPYSNVRWMLDYVVADREDVGEVDTVQMRFQIDF